MGITEYTNARAHSVQCGKVVGFVFRFSPVFGSPKVNFTKLSHLYDMVDKHLVLISAAI